ncbi:helix-turn-helix domain-containing protein [Roseovarius tibetensis]|uniref:helix-turn-helix domain-containing protein n=1 Tax=Roseovarius tibetensis TaxID=2685897 RepID=UPI003D7FD011
MSSGQKSALNGRSPGSHNAEGLEGLSNRRSGGRPPRMTPEQKATLADWVRAGPDRTKDGVVRWRRINLKHRLEAEFGVVMHERTVGKHLTALGFRRLSVCPQHPKSDPEAQKTLKTFSARVDEALADHARGKPLEVWFQE